MVPLSDRSTGGSNAQLGWMAPANTRNNIQHLTTEEGNTGNSVEPAQNIQVLKPPVEDPSLKEILPRWVRKELINGFQQYTTGILAHTQKKNFLLALTQEVLV